MTEANRHSGSLIVRGDFIKPTCGFISNRRFEKMFPSLWDWAGVSSHFRESD